MWTKGLKSYQADNGWFTLQMILSINICVQSIYFRRHANTNNRNHCEIYIIWYILNFDNLAMVFRRGLHHQDFSNPWACRLAVILLWLGIVRFRITLVSETLVKLVTIKRHPHNSPSQAYLWVPWKKIIARHWECAVLHCNSIPGRQRWVETHVRFGSDRKSLIWLVNSHRSRAWHMVLLFNTGVVTHSSRKVTIDTPSSLCPQSICLCVDWYTDSVLKSF